MHEAREMNNGVTEPLVVLHVLRAGVILRDRLPVEVYRENDGVGEAGGHPLQLRAALPVPVVAELAPVGTIQMSKAAYACVSGGQGRSMGGCEQYQLCLVFRRYRIEALGRILADTKKVQYDSARE